MKDPRPGAHGERIPPDSHAFIAECAPEHQAVESPVELRHMEALHPRPRTPHPIVEGWVTVDVKVRSHLPPRLALDSILRMTGRSLIPEWRFPDDA